MKKNSFVEGALIATVAVVITKILGMLYVIPFYQIIGTQGGALYSYAYNIYTIFLGISSAGIPIAISKIISEYSTLGYDEAKVRAFKIGTRLIGYISIVAFIVMFLGADLMAASILGDITGGNTVQDVAFVIRCISFAVIIIPYLSVTKGYIQGHRIMAPSSIGSIIEQVVRIFVILAGSFLAYKVFSSTLTLAVGIAVSGAFFGGLAAYIYLRHKMNQSREELGLVEHKKKDAITDREIIKKILAFSLPFIIINIATSIYNFTDMVLILRGLDMLGFSAADAEFIQSAITTWSTKICMIINAFAMGLGASLTPNIVESHVKGDWKGVETKLNKAFQMILSISIPCALGLCILATPVWRIFYGESTFGPLVLQIMVISTVFANLYSIMFNTMQSLNKYKIVYTSVIAGFASNALLDIPLILLFDKMGIPAFWGATVSTIIGYLISMAIAYRDLRKNHGIKVGSTYKMVGKILIPVTVMTIVLLVFNHFITFGTDTIGSLLTIVVNAIIGATIYFVLAFKLHIFDEIFGRPYINKMIKKLTFNRVSLKD